MLHVLLLLEPSLPSLPPAAPVTGTSQHRDLGSVPRVRTSPTLRSPAPRNALPASMASPWSWPGLQACGRCQWSSPRQVRERRTVSLARAQRGLPLRGQLGKLLQPTSFICSRSL